MQPASSDAAVAWAGLGEPWRACLSLAWSAYGAGTIPVGAVLVDATGAIVAEGRNRIYEPVAPPGQLANSLLAHAEVNALVALDPERRYEDHVLYTALEPCLLCVGATVMATVGRIRYAGADPYGGGDGGLTGVNPHVERVPLRIDGPRHDPFGVLASALLLAFFMRRKPTGHVVHAYERRLPSMLAVADAMLEAGAPEAAAAGVPLADALPGFWPYLTTVSMRWDVRVIACCCAAGTSCRCDLGTAGAACRGPITPPPQAHHGFRCGTVSPWIPLRSRSGAER